jgi:hypothetical protein
MKKFLLIPFLFIACKTQKSTTEYKEVIKVDTFIRTQTNTIYKGVIDTITIDNPCDSLGIINQFYSKLILPNGTIQIKSKGNKLVAIANFNDISSSNKQEKQISNQTNTNKIQKEIIKYRTPSWIIATILIESIVILLYLYFRFLILR